MVDLRAKVSKNSQRLKLTYGKNIGIFELTNGELNLIEIDIWISDILFKEYEKVQLRKKLTGASGSNPFSGANPQ